MDQQVNKTGELKQLCVGVDNLIKKSVLLNPKLIDLFVNKQKG